MRRAFERRVLRLDAEGCDHGEIARRFKRSRATIERVIVMADLPRGEQVASQPEQTLRPIERRVLRWRDAGAGPAEIGARFHKSAGHISRVEGFARRKLAAGASGSINA
jgi:DNA-binding CsgD family transcriptional regulator